MTQLSRHIRHLICLHDCVVVPGWGALIAHRTAAAYDSATGRFAPPSRELTFNASLQRGDGLLAHSIARQQGVSFERASVILEREVEAMKSRFDLDGEMNISGVGRFVRQEGEGETPLFIADAEGVANAAFALLPTLRLAAQSNEAEAFVAQEQPVETEEVAAARESERRLRNFRFTPWVRVAASVALIATIGAAWLTGSLELPETHVDTASLAPRHRAAEVRTIETPEAATPTGNLFIAAPTAADATIELNPEALEAPADAQKFYLVVASLTSQSKARAWISRHRRKNLDMEILHAGKGRWRVYVATGSTYRAAWAHKASLPSRFRDAWVCWE